MGSSMWDPEDRSDPREGGLGSRAGIEMLPFIIAVGGMRLQIAVTFSRCCQSASPNVREPRTHGNASGGGRDGGRGSIAACTMDAATDEMRRGTLPPRLKRPSRGVGLPRYWATRDYNCTLFW